MKIDITTSATIRPGLLDQTLSSFRTHMLSDAFEYRFIINVDPLGEKGQTADDVLDVARSHFKEVVYRKPDTACFADAIIWCWKQTVSDLVFHLEDDWILLKPIDLQTMLNTIAHFLQYDSFRLSKTRVAAPPKRRVVPYEHLSLNPVFIRQPFIQQAVACMMINKNPEKQLRIVDPECGRFIKKTKHAIYVEQGSQAIVKDTGRKWMNTTGLYSKVTGFLGWTPLKK